MKEIPSKARIPLVAIVGNSGTGKTTLMTRLIPELKRRGLRVGTIKHDVHGFEIDKPGKDSWRHKDAGASMVLISSPFQMAMVRDVDHDSKLDELEHHFTGVDIILAEGFKNSGVPKLEVFREEVQKEPVCGDDKHLLGLITDSLTELDVPHFPTDDIRGIADFLMVYFGLASSKERGIVNTAS
jgi:molybdopterin-guanine dinucleotide biosynthesis adapter protein